MRKVKTLKGFLSQCIQLADFDFYQLKGYDDLTAEEQTTLGSMVAGLQNELGDDETVAPILEKFNLKWKG